MVSYTGLNRKEMKDFSPDEYAAKEDTDAKKFFLAYDKRIINHVISSLGNNNRSISNVNTSGDFIEEYHHKHLTDSA